MSEWILDESRTVPVELVLNRLQDFRALGSGALDYAVDIREIYVEAHRARADGGRAGVSLAHAGIFVSQHDVRVANLQFGVTHFAVRATHANEFSRAENLLVVL